MRTLLILLGVISTGCGRGDLLEPQNVAEGALHLRGRLTVSPAKKGLLNIEIPAQVDFTIVGSEPLGTSQTAFTSARRFDGMTQPVTVRPLALGATALENLRLAQTGVSIEVENVVATVGGGAVTVRGSVSTFAGDVLDQTTFTGTLLLTREPGGANVQLRSVRPNGALRPFDELEVRVEQPVSSSDLTNLTVLQNGTPITVSVLATSTPFTNVFRVRANELMLPGARLTLAGDVSHGQVALTVPSAPQVKVEDVVGGGWQSTSFEERGKPKPVAADAPPAAGPLMQVSNGASIWRREVVPPTARRLTLWVQSLSTSQQAPYGATAKVAASTQPGSATVLAGVEPSHACKVDHFSLCSAWTEVSYDVSGLTGRTLYLEANSTVPAQLGNLFDGFQVAEPHFEN
ncbi:MAG: hypothetical protein Q8L14_41440 [Myxococcales bacterium]|nr:hypothetical protein [Myxococcales bacterium]